jgi:tRNA(Ile)-lysidine synthetase-like protein
LSENASGLLRQIRSRTGPLIEKSLTLENDGTWVVDLAAAGFIERIPDHPGSARDESASAGHAIDNTLLIVFFGDLFADKIGFDADLTRAHYEQLARLVADPLASGKMISLPGCTIKKEYQTLRIMRIPPRRYAELVARDNHTVLAPVTITFPGRTSAPDLLITTEILDRGDVPNPALKSFDNEAYFDLQQITPPLTLRTPLPGDRMRPFGMSGTKKLSDIFVDKKIPASRRGGMPIITDNEHIIWIVGVASSETTRVGDRTQKVVKISIEKT